MNITGGKFNSRKVKAPDSDEVRPTLSKIRESIFNMLSAFTDFENSKFLDMFSGSGIISLEAVSRGFEKVVSIEKNYKTAKLIKENFLSLGIEPNLIIKDSVKAVDTLNDKFDVIYLDPPYENTELYEKALNKIIEKNFLSENGIIIVEKQKNIEFKIPSGYSLIKDKIYGDVKIEFYKIN